MRDRQNNGVMSMRLVGLMLLTTTVASLGSTCIPLVDGDARTPEQGNRLGVAIISPSNDVTIAQGETVQIKWSAANLTGAVGTLDFVAESRENLNQVTIAEGLTINQGSNQGTVTWDTAGLSGPFQIYANISAGGLSTSEDSAGRVTVVAGATFRFLAPSSDATFAPGDSLVIRWNGRGTGAQATIRLDPDADHESGNETTLAVRDLAENASDDTLNFAGNDSTGAAVAPGTYRLFANVTDSANPELTIDATAQITITAAGSTGLRIISPSTDTEFLSSADPLEIKFGLGLSADALVDLKIDTDDDRSNGNEVTILGQRLEEQDTVDDTFGWNGTNTDGGAVDDGIYKVILLASTGSGDPSAAVGNGLIFRRTSANQPLIGLLAPATTATIKPGQFLAVKWRDEDPDDTATIRIAIDDDPRPGEGEPGAADDIAEETILAGRTAKDDGVQDSFSWQIPNTLDPGTYYVFAYITKTGDLTASNRSVAGGRFIIEDPNKP